MKKSLAIATASLILLACVLALTPAMTYAQDNGKPELGGKDVGQPGPQPDTWPKELLRHVVLFKFKDGTTDAQVKKVVDAFAALKGQIDVIRDLEWGSNVSEEGLSQGFTQAFVLTFFSTEERDQYLHDPAHVEFTQIAGQYLDKALVVDYWVHK